MKLVHVLDVLFSVFWMCLHGACLCMMPWLMIYVINLNSNIIRLLLVPILGAFTVLHIVRTTGIYTAVVNAFRALVNKED